jgi:prepilin-type processing-associated H-X9-DG protein
VAIIALLISILLPSLTCARESARAARCGAQLRGLGIGMNSYITSNNEWIPGVNTSGLALRRLQFVSITNPSVLYQSDLPAQPYDWMTPILRYDTSDLGKNRAEKFQTLLNRYACPSQFSVNSEVWSNSAAPDLSDFSANKLNDSWRAVSYLMPAHFQYWGEANAGAGIDNFEGMPPNSSPILAKVIPTNWEVLLGKFVSRLDKLGTAARKVAAADGTRYLDQSDLLDHDVSTDVEDSRHEFGAFTDPGAWWGGSQAYGVKSGTSNWDGDTLTHPNRYPDAKGRAMALTYRHGCTDRGATLSSAQQNKGAINALFFDGHVSRFNDRQSREIVYWYPSGAIVQKPSEGLTRVPQGFVIP